MTTPEKQADRWYSRELPVLLVIAERMNANPADAVHDALLLRELHQRGVLDDRDQMMDSLSALHPTYIDASLTASGGTRLPTRATVHDLTDLGREVTGLWPTAEDTTEAFLEALRLAEEQTTDPEQKKLLRRGLESFGSVSSSILSNVIAAVIVRQSGIG